MDESDRSRSTVVLVDVVVDAIRFQVDFPGASLVCVDTRSDAGRHEDGRCHPPEWAYTDTPQHWRSAVVLRALQALAKGTKIAYLEFPDWGALGFCTLQERLFAGFLADTQIAVRLHSTHTVLLNMEAWSVSRQDLSLIDLERKCLRDCDTLIAQLPSVGESARKIHGFAPEEWEPRLRCHAPPVLLDHRDPVTSSVPARADQPIAFTSKLQRVKRPDLFVRGASAFARRRSDYGGSFQLSAHSNDAAYESHVRHLIPPDQGARFQFLPKLSAQEREAVIANSTVVVPSGYESFCLAAYEASLLGARVILNGVNPAFDEHSPWIDGVNCFKFDGTASGLTDALERSFAQSGPLQSVELRQDPWPWSVETVPKRWSQAVAEPMVSVVVPHFNLGKHLPATLSSILESDYQNIEVIVVDDASTDAHSRSVIEALQRVESPRLKMVCLEGNIGLAAVRNTGVRHAEGKYLLTLDADDLIDHCFIGMAVAALENNPTFNVVVTPAAYFVDGSEPAMRTGKDAVDYAVFTGEAKVAGLLDNRFSTATAVFRADALRAFPYNEDLNCYEDWSLYMRMCEAGTRFIVTTDVFFHYRRRADSMVHKPRDAERMHTEYSDLLRTSAPAALRAGSSVLALGIASPFRGSIPHLEQVASPPAQQHINLLLARVARLEQMTESVLRATSPFERMMRIPRSLWRRLLPLRHQVARMRGRI
ncbi:MAG: glycosyltransferase [Proteobacteria bacterium]|nr:glycosyltransferase [Pseudomonadota bacterium]